MFQNKKYKIKTSILTQIVIAMHFLIMPIFVWKVGRGCIISWLNQLQRAINLFVACVCMCVCLCVWVEVEWEGEGEGGLDKFYNKSIIVWDWRWLGWGEGD